MKRLACLVVFVCFFCLPIALKAETLSIVFVDLQRVMLESEKGKEAKRLLTDEANKIKKNLDIKQSEIQKMKDALEKQTATITPEARADKEKQYQAKLKDYQRIVNDSQAELQQKDMEYTQKILKEVEDIVKAVAAKEKYTMIIEKNQGGILFGAPSIDITAKIITAFNESGKRPAAAPAKR